MATSKTKKLTFVKGLKTEWSLFWDSVLGDDIEIGADENVEIKDPFITGKIQVLSSDQIKIITKALSSDRKILNQKLESVSLELDLSAAKLESLRLVGSETEDTESKINELSDLGQELSEKLAKINERLKITREREKELRN